MQPNINYPRKKENTYFFKENSNPVRYKFHNSKLKLTLSQKTNGLKTFTKANFRFAIFKQLFFERIISKKFKY